MKIPGILILSIFLFYQNYLIAQTDISLIHRSDCFYLDSVKLGSLNIKNISYTEFLSPEFKEKNRLNSELYSRVTQLSFKNGMLNKEIWSYSGVDAQGIDHLKSSNGKFSSFPYESEKNYEENTLQASTENNDPVSKNIRIISIMSSEEGSLMLDNIPAEEFIMLNISENHDYDYIFIKVEKNRMIYYKLK